MHSIFVIPAVVVVGLQVWLSKHPRFHREVGKVFKYMIFPMLVITGGMLTLLSVLHKKTHLVPLSSVFLCYGYSYTVVGVETLGYVTISREWIHFIGVLMWTKCLHQLTTLQTIISFELFILLYPLPWIHITQMRHRRIQHEIKGLLLNYLGMLGTAFTVSHDRYWIFPHTLSLPYRLLIQNTPLLLTICYGWYSLKKANAKSIYAKVYAGSPVACGHPTRSGEHRIHATDV